MAMVIYSTQPLSTTPISSQLVSGLTGPLAAEQVTGIYNILLVSTRIASDHMKFMRMYADPTEDIAFTKATELANNIDQIRKQLSNTLEPVPPNVVTTLVQEAIPYLHNTINLKNLAIQMAQTCQIQLLLPINVLFHLRREIDFFLGNFDMVIKNQLTKSRDILGLPGPSQQLMTTVPLNLIDKMPLQEAISANLAWIELFVKHNIEHADLLLITDRADMERSYIENALNDFKQRFRNLLNIILVIDFQQHQDIDHIQQCSIDLAREWKSYLASLLYALRNCQLQENFPQRLVEHMIIETDLHEEASMRLVANMNGVPLTVASIEGAIYSQITPKEILLS